MVQFGDEFIIESYKIPWLIWIQLVVMVLVILLLYFGLSVFTETFSGGGGAAPPPAQMEGPSSSHGQRRTKVEDQRLTRDAVANGGSLRECDENEDESSLKESMILKMFRSPNHPCNYIGLVKQAFLKCLGLDSSSERPRNHHHDKEE